MNGSPITRSSVQLDLTATGVYVIGEAPWDSSGNYGIHETGDGARIKLVHGRHVDVSVEVWGHEPPLEARPGEWSNVTEFSIRRTDHRIAIGNNLTVDLPDTNDSYRLRLYETGADARHLIRVWPAPHAAKWRYHLTQAGQPKQRPNRSGENLTVTLTYGQATTVWCAAGNECGTVPLEGDVRDVAADCSVIKAAFDGARSEDHADVEATFELTARQWDVSVAALDKWGLLAFYLGDSGDAEDQWRVRDVILAQIGSSLPQHPPQSAHAATRLVPGEQQCYVVFPSHDPIQAHGPSRRDKAPPEGGTGLAYSDGHTVTITADQSEVSLAAELLPTPPITDIAAWDDSVEVSCIFNDDHNRELIAAVPQQPGHALWEFTEDTWPHVTYRIRVSTRGRGTPEGEQHRVQIWPGHSGPPTVTSTM